MKTKYFIVIRVDNKGRITGKVRLYKNKRNAELEKNILNCMLRTNDFIVEEIEKLD